MQKYKQIGKFIRYIFILAASPEILLFLPPVYISTYFIMYHMYIPSFYRPFLVFLNVKKRESSSTKVSNLRVNLLSEKAGAQH